MDNIPSPGIEPMERSVSRRGGFSLIELIMVVVLVGIIAITVSPLIFRGGTGITVSAMARKIADDIRYTQALAMQRYKLTTPSVVNPTFRYRIRFNVADTNCTGANQYTIVNDQDNDGTWGENPNENGIVESARKPDTGDEYFCVDLENTREYSGISISADFGGSVSGVLEFDNMGIPYDSDGNRLTSEKTITVSKGGESSTVTVTPFTGRVYVQ